MSILDNELVRKYFCTAGDYTADPVAVIAAMQQPIKAEDRILFIQTDGEIVERIGTSFTNKWDSEVGFHPIYLRLPDAFQKQECPNVIGTCSCGMVIHHPDIATRRTEPTPSPEKCGDTHTCEHGPEFHKPKDAPFMCEDVMCECHIPGHTRHHLNKDAAVEEKIMRLHKWFSESMDSSYHYELKEILRDLVRMARETK